HALRVRPLVPVWSESAGVATSASGFPDAELAYSPQTRSAGRSLRMTVRQTLPRAAGSTHASSVIPVVRCRAAESGIDTLAFVPLKDSALPYLPVVAQVAF